MLGVRQTTCRRLPWEYPDVRINFSASPSRLSSKDDTQEPPGLPPGAKTVTDQCHQHNPLRREQIKLPICETGGVGDCVGAATVEMPEGDNQSKGRFRRTKKGTERKESDGAAPVSTPQHIFGCFRGPQPLTDPNLSRIFHATPVQP